ncbi:hypothetical protein BDQ17DRAFT_1424799 [Cyathus striatus]|nr:hypothetical protein BDQ17DRAFT_1424799 [Cyathus striatus]
MSDIMEGTLTPLPESLEATPAAQDELLEVFATPRRRRHPQGPGYTLMDITEADLEQSADQNPAPLNRRSVAQRARRERERLQRIAAAGNNNAPVAQRVHREHERLQRETVIYNDNTLLLNRRSVAQRARRERERIEREANRGESLAVDLNRHSIAQRARRERERLQRMTTSAEQNQDEVMLNGLPIVLASDNSEGNQVNDVTELPVINIHQLNGNINGLTAPGPHERQIADENEPPMSARLLAMVHQQHGCRRRGTNNSSSLHYPQLNRRVMAQRIRREHDRFQRLLTAVNHTPERRIPATREHEQLEPLQDIDINLLPMWIFAETRQPYQDPMGRDDLGYMDVECPTVVHFTGLKKQHLVLSQQGHWNLECAALMGK